MMHMEGFAGSRVPDRLTMASAEVSVNGIDDSQCAKQRFSLILRRIAPAKQAHVYAAVDRLAQKSREFCRMHGCNSGVQSGHRTRRGIGVRSIDLILGHGRNPAEKQLEEKRTR